MAVGALVASGVLSLGSSLFGKKFAEESAYQQYKYQSALQRKAAQLNYDYSLKSAENMPSSTRKGLEKANYNPMLAVQNSTSGANSSWTSSGQAVAPDTVGGMTQGIANAQSFQRLKNETMQAESATDANYATADKTKAEKAMLIEKLPWVSKKEKAEYMKTIMNSAKLENDIHYQNEYLKYLENQLVLQEKLGLMGIDANIYGSNVQREKNLIELDKTMRYNEWAKEHPLLVSISETAERHPSLFDYERYNKRYNKRYGRGYYRY